ncbi:hypothetical protein EDD11_007873 [Mortierella claussenii]|nr:hypothetical protein EDD11_007873 [Mortierella claussenii]
MTFEKPKQAFQARAASDLQPLREAIIEVDTEDDPITGEVVLLWRPILQVFRNMAYISEGTSTVSGMTDKATLQDLLPLRIKYRPGVVLKVIMRDSEPVASSPSAAASASASAASSASASASASSASSASADSAASTTPSIHSNGCHVKTADPQNTQRQHSIDDDALKDDCMLASEHLKLPPRCHPEPHPGRPYSDIRAA